MFFRQILGWARCGGLLCLLGVLGPALPVLSQTAEQAPVPSALVQLQLVSETPSETRFRLTFAPRLNHFGAVGSGSQQASLGFALSSRGNAVKEPVGLTGFVRQITFEQMDTVLIVHFGTAAAAQLTSTALDQAHVEVVVSNGVEKPAQASAPQPTPPASPAASLPPGADGYQMVMLNYADVSEVVGLLTDGSTVKANNSFTPREPGFGSNGLSGNNNFAQMPIANANADDQPIGQSVDASIAIDRRLNAVWLKGTPERIARMKAQIALIDIPVDSVTLETQLVELTESGVRAVGIDFNNANGQLAQIAVQTGAYIPVGFVTNGANRLSSASLQAAIYAQVQKGEGRIVSRPRIAAQSGGTAKIITGDALPILTSITLSGVNGVSQQVQYVNVGVTLQIAPRVTPDGYVTSQVFCVVSSVSGYSQGYPTISQREAQTTATVRDGEVFVIGGLTQESSITTNSKVPVLGDVPVLGAAFRTNKANRSKTELYIIITPHVVRRAPELAIAAPLGKPVDHPVDHPQQVASDAAAVASSPR
jgi:general secretion pathway protein D